MKTNLTLLAEHLPDEARWWVKSLSPIAYVEIARLVEETGIENFAVHWREHKAELEALEHAFATRL